MHTNFLDKKQHSAWLNNEPVMSYTQLACISSKYSNITVATTDREHCHFISMNSISQAASNHFHHKKQRNYRLQQLYGSEVNIGKLGELTAIHQCVTYQYFLTDLA